MRHKLGEPILSRLTAFPQSWSSQVENTHERPIRSHKDIGMIQDNQKKGKGYDE